MAIFLLMALAALIAVVVIRTLKFTPKSEEPVEAAPVAVDREKVVRDMQDMIRCRTVSHSDESLTDFAEFDRFHALLAERFPLVHRAAALEHVGKTGLLYTLRGRHSDKPSVLMAHYDVVPASEDGWTKPPFDAVIEDGCIWGRGTLDTKGTLLGVFEALESLLHEGYVPEQDLYLSFAGDEEVSGPSCPAIVSLLKSRGITPEIVLDEGGAVVSGAFPGVKREFAVIGIAEKGGLNLRFSMQSQGGHASTPPPRPILTQLAAALVRIGKHPFKSRITPPVAQMLDTLGRHSTFLYRMIFANLWLFAPVLDLYCRMSGGELNALLRTTVAPTRFEGSPAYNVLPPEAGFGLNLRLLPGETIESAAAYLKKIVNNEKIAVEVVGGMNPSIVSSTDCEGYTKLVHAIRQTWPEAIASPYLMMACSDSRHYCQITDKVYRFSAMRLSKEERAMIHGNDERVPIDTLVTTVQFYTRLLHLL